MRTCRNYVVEKTGPDSESERQSLNHPRSSFSGWRTNPTSTICANRKDLKLYDLFKASGANVDYYDPHATHFISKSGKMVRTIDYNLQDFGTYDCMVLITSHQSFDLKPGGICAHSDLDTRNAIKGIERRIFQAGQFGAANSERVGSGCFWSRPLLWLFRRNEEGGWRPSFLTGQHGLKVAVLLCYLAIASLLLSQAGTENTGGRPGCGATKWMAEAPADIVSSRKRSGSI